MTFRGFRLLSFVSKFKSYKLNFGILYHSRYEMYRKPNHASEIYLLHTSSTNAVNIEPNKPKLGQHRRESDVTNYVNGVSLVQ